MKCQKEVVALCIVLFLQVTLLYMCTVLELSMKASLPCFRYKLYIQADHCLSVCLVLQAYAADYRQLAPIISKFISFLHKFVTFNPQRATSILQNHVDLLG